MDDQKIRAIVEWQAPANVGQLSLFCQLLSPVHFRLFRKSRSFKRSLEERTCMGLDNRVPESIFRAQASHNRGTCVETAGSTLTF